MEEFFLEKSMMKNDCKINKVFTNLSDFFLSKNNDWNLKKILPNMKNKVIKIKEKYKALMNIKFR